MQRVRNHATPAELMKVLRGVSPHAPDLKGFCVPSPEKVVAHAADILEDVLRATARPTQKVLEEAAVGAWDMEPGEAELFAQRVASAASFCRTKSRQASSGKKLSPAVMRIVQVLRQTSEDNTPVVTTGPNAKQRAELEDNTPPNLKKRAGLDSQIVSRPAIPSTAASSSTDDLGQLRAMYG